MADMAGSIKYPGIVGRRLLLRAASAAALLPLLGALFPTPSRATTLPDLKFLVMYKGAPVGEHRVEFQSDGDRLVVATHIDITVRVLFFTPFRFLHDAVEVWHAGRLMSVESSTNDNGTLLEVTGAAASGGFRITGEDGPFLAEPQLLTTNALWNNRLLQETRVIDVQHGGEVGLVVSPLGKEQVATPRGTVAAHRYRIITPNYAGSLFFNDEGHWVKGLIERQGEILEYALVS